MAMDHHSPISTPHAGQRTLSKLLPQSIKRTSEVTWVATSSASGTARCKTASARERASADGTRSGSAGMIRRYVSATNQATVTHMADPVSEFEQYREELLAALNGEDPVLVLRATLNEVD